MDRADAIVAIAKSTTLAELLKFTKHENKHVRHASRVKAFRLFTDTAEVSKIIGEIVKTTADYSVGLLAARGDAEEEKKLKKPPSDYFWTARAVVKYGTATYG